jgi:hypothetical protein
VDDLAASDLGHASAAIAAYALLLGLARISRYGMFYVYGGIMRFVERSLAQ